MRHLSRVLATTALVAAATLGGPFAEAKTLVVGVADNLTTLDPPNANDTLSAGAMRNIYQGLYGFDEKMQLEPLLATSYEANADATQFTFHLRKGVKFHDGTDFNAEAVKINIDRVRDTKVPTKRQSLVSMVDHVEVIDPLTVKVVLKEPFGAMVNNLAHAGLFMISPAALQKYGKDIDRNPVGTGPFVFKKWSGDLFETVKNPNYWREGYPKVDGVTFKSVPENGSRIAMLQAGEAAFVYPLPSELAPVVTANKTLEVVKVPSIIIRYVAMNTMKKPFDDVRVREALNYAIDKNAFCKVVYGGYCKPAEGPVPDLLKYSSAVQKGGWPYDPKKAKALLAEAGYPNGFETEMFSKNNSTYIRAMQFLQQQMAQVGVKLTVTPLEAGVEAQRIWSVAEPKDATVQMQYGGWSASTGDIDWALRPLFYGKGFPPKLFNVAYYKSEATDTGIEAGIATADDAKRTSEYQAVQKQIWTDAPWIFLTDDEILVGQTKSLTGAFAAPDGGLNFEKAAFK